MQVGCHASLIDIIEPLMCVTVIPGHYECAGPSGIDRIIAASNNLRIEIKSFSTTITSWTSTGRHKIRVIPISASDVTRPSHPTKQLWMLNNWRTNQT